MIDLSLPPLNNALIVVRQYHKLSIPRTSQKTGISVPTINQIERGNQEAQRIHAELYADAFDLSLRNIYVFRHLYKKAQSEHVEWSTKLGVTLVNFLIKDYSDDHTDARWFR